jgi:hypothetical protein
MSDLEYRLKHDLEPVLELADPRERISAYHDMPYALFRYEPDEEFDLRKQVTLLETRLTQKGKRVKRISLAECLNEAMCSQRPLEDWFAAERGQDTDTIVGTVHSVLSEYAPLSYTCIPAPIPPCRERCARCAASPPPKSPAPRSLSATTAASMFAASGTIIMSIRPRRRQDLFS